MNATELGAIALLLLVPVLLILFVFWPKRAKSTIPWRCRAFGSHKFYSMETRYIQDYCLRCGFYRKGGPS